MPGLDGLRALAVAVVVAYHLGVSFMPGGLLGVAVFFTLSGYLITDILLSRWIGGESGLGEFWLRRARRLLPGLYLMLLVVSVWVVVGDRSQLSEVRGQSIGALLYVNNWWQIYEHISYFARFGSPSPLNHLWSLAVEEQFYIVWPWLLVIGVRVFRDSPRTVGVRPRLAAATLVLAAASAIEMAVLYHPSFTGSRVYEGTDTRAFGLLFGAALAMVWPSRALVTHRISDRARRTLDRAGCLGLAVIAVMVWRTGQYSSFLYHGGLVIISIATVLVIAALAHPATKLGRALGSEPLRWIGVRSYGIYLWHVPIIVLTNPALAQGFSFPRAALQVAATVVVAHLSWRYVESPIRRGRLGALIMHARLVGWGRVSAWWRAGGAVAAAAIVAVIVAVAVARPAPPSAAAAVRGGTAVASASETGATAARHRAQLVSYVMSGDPNRTSCRTIVHFGDSTSDGLNSPNYLPDARQRITAQYRRVGAVRQTYEIQGATSIVETINGDANAAQVATGLRRAGYRGCWVLALGTNDTADVAVGSNVGLAERITRMMSIIGSEPVLWVNVRSLVPSGPYQEENMAAWNAALTQACTRYPNMRVFNWAADAESGWFITDGIHYTSEGYKYRAQLIASALARAVPLDGASQGCLVDVPIPAPRSTRPKRPSVLTIRSGPILVAQGARSQ